MASEHGEPAASTSAGEGTGGSNTPPPAAVVPASPTSTAAAATTTPTKQQQQQATTAGTPRKANLRSDVKKLLALYHDCLVRRPIATKALTSAIISLLGDLLATWKGGSPKNLRRTLAFFVYGGAVTGPVCHYWYGFLEEKLKRLQGASNVAAKVFLDKAIFTPPFLAVTLFLLRLLESGRPRASLEGAKAVYLPSLKTNLKVWTVAQIVNFKYVPPAYRVLFGNVVALWWSFYLSRSNARGAGPASSLVLSRKMY